MSLQICLAFVAASAVALVIKLAGGSLLLAAGIWALMARRIST